MLPMIALAPSLISKLKLAVAASAVIIIAVLFLRINYLAEQNAIYKKNEKGYMATISELRDDAERRDAVSLADRNDSVANEMRRSEVIGDINASEVTHGCGTVVHRTIDSLLGTNPNTRDN